jgi:alkylation response protein AidB-like acyl-CoA dehydrogenase
MTTEILTRLVLHDPTPAGDDIAAWWNATAALRARFARSIERALVTALVAPTPGAAFLAGYHAAMGALVPALGGDHRAALCATEDGGAHPRTIETRLVETDGGYTLDGVKRFVTGGRDADVLVVLANAGVTDDGRNRLALVTLPARTAGVTFDDMPELPFVPDVSHTSVRFDGVRVGADARLPGDGWTDYVKPFRTIEDLHVQAAVTAWLVGVVRRSESDRGLVERLVAHAASLTALADTDRESPATHIALAGAFANLQAIIEAMDAWWKVAPAGLRAMWERDRRLLRVASNARAQRLERAWTLLAARA